MDDASILWTIGLGLLLTVPFGIWSLDAKRKVEHILARQLIWGWTLLAFSILGAWNVNNSHTQIVKLLVGAIAGSVIGLVLTGSLIFLTGRHGEAQETKLAGRPRFFANRAPLPTTGNRSLGSNVLNIVEAERRLLAVTENSKRDRKAAQAHRKRQQADERRTAAPKTLGVLGSKRDLSTPSNNAPPEPTRKGKSRRVDAMPNMASNAHASEPATNDRFIQTNLYVEFPSTVQPPAPVGQIFTLPLQVPPIGKMFDGVEEGFLAQGSFGTPDGFEEENARVRRCRLRIVNYGTATLFDVRLVLRVEFRKLIQVKPHVYNYETAQSRREVSVSIPRPIQPSQAFEFDIDNLSENALAFNCVPVAFASLAVDDKPSPTKIGSERPPPPLPGLIRKGKSDTKF